MVEKRVESAGILSSARGQLWDFCELAHEAEKACKSSEPLPAAQVTLSSPIQSPRIPLEIVYPTGIRVRLGETVSEVQLSLILSELSGGA